MKIIDSVVIMKGWHFGILCDKIEVVKKDGQLFEFTFYNNNDRKLYYAVELPENITSAVEAIEEIKKFKYINEGHSETF